MQPSRVDILFVCTGNTCRSPMAEAIARQLITDLRYEGPAASVASAGVSASRGSPATPEAVEAMRTMGLDLSGHRSRPLTAEMVAKADLVFAMTESHARVARQIAAEHASKVVRLDENQDIDDPFGGPQALYHDVAERLTRVISKRLADTVNAAE